MNKIGQFVFDVIVNNLGLPITSNDYGSSRQIFYNYTIRDSVFLGDTAAYELHRVIMEKCYEDNDKKVRLTNYLKTYLVSNEELEVMNDEDFNFEYLVNLVISKFTNPNNPDFSAKLDKSVYKKAINDDEDRYITAKKIKELYKKSLEYKHIDIDVVFMYSRSIIETIYKYIRRTYDNENISDYIKSIMPKKVNVSVKNIENTLNAIDANIENNDKKDLVDSFLYSVKVTVTWFIKRYLKCVDMELDSFDISKKFDKHDDVVINNIKAVDAEELVKIKNCTLYDIVDETVKMDYDSIEDLEDVEHHTVNQWVSVVNMYPETWKIICDEDYNIVGYWHFLVLYEDEYQRAKEGEIIDSDISMDMMPIMIPGVYNVYFMIICLKPEYRKTYVFKVMIDSILKRLEAMAQSGVFVNEICALAYSDDGVALCRSIGLKYYKHHSVHGDIYCGNVFDLLDKHFCREFVKLKELYKNM